MVQKRFNLIDEPWLLVLTQEGQTKPVSLRQLFADAHRLYALAGEMPTQDAAILRLLLGILYAVFGWQDLQGNEGLPQTAREAYARWQALWELGHFPAAMVEEYLRRYEERFYLFHPATPFMQVALAEEASVTVDGKTLPVNPAEKGIRYLIGDLAESGNKPRLFSARTQKNEITYAEAARWLVHMNAFDVSPGGAPPGDGFRANGYKLPWPNTLGLVWAEGNNLFETLMLNFVLAPTGQDLWQDFVPAWEEENPFTPQQLTQIQLPFPADPCALLTFPFRRMQLQCDENERISKYILWGGHRIEAAQGNPFHEQMTMWRLDAQGNHAPKSHDPARQMWRDLAAILPGTDKSQAPGVLNWISQLKAHQALRLPMLRLNSAGMRLSKSTSVSNVFSDSLRFHLALLDNLPDGFAAQAIEEVALADKMVWQTGLFAGNLIQAGGGSGERDIAGASATAREQAYFLLDAPFRAWLEGLDEQADMTGQRRAWRQTALQVLRNYAQQLVQQAGLKAMVGRLKTGKGDDKQTLYASPLLYTRFEKKLYQLIKE